MRRFSWFFFFLPLLIWSEELQVHLTTRSELPLLYMSSIETDASSYDWRYLDELRSALEFDLSTCGMCSLLPQKNEWDELLPINDHRKHFNVSFWKKQGVPFVLVLEATKARFRVTAVLIDKEASKTYPDLLLTNAIDLDRQAIHELADKIQRDLFRAAGICTLRILYTVRTKTIAPEWDSHVWISSADGTNARQLTTGHLYCLSPSFLPSPESTADFCFVGHEEGQAKIYKASFHDPTPTPMVPLRGNQLLPSLSLKGTHLAFISDVAGRPDLFVQHLYTDGGAAGKARQIFSAPRATQASPTFSPDAKQIAFVSDKDGPPRIYILPLLPPNHTQKLNPRLITRKNRENTSPSWSPDGKKIAYSAKVDGVRQIWIYNVEKEEEIQLTTGPEHKENPAWAPNSFHLVYNTESEDSCELYLINLAQKTPVQITKGPGQKRFASWEPS